MGRSRDWLRAVASEPDLALMSASDGDSRNALPGVRQVTRAEADRVTELFALAFYRDPTWSWAFPDADGRMDHHRIWWGLYLHSALPHGCVWMTVDGGAAAIWIPPGKPELSGDDEARVEPLLLGRMLTTCWPCWRASSPTIHATRRTTT
jgi:hypothetical protein